MRYRTLVVAVIAALAPLALPAPAPAVTYEPSSRFCSEPVLRDFLAPLSRMPKLHSPPASGRVGFGPASLIIRSRPALVVDEREVGYTLALRPSAPVARLDWDIVTTLTRIDRRGGPVETRRRVRRHVNVVAGGHGAGVRFPIGPEPAFYRLTSVFLDNSGRKVGGYGFYFRAVTPTARARLTLAEDSLRPGGEVIARIDNLGTTLVRYGTPYWIERFDGTAWTRAPESPRGPWIAIGLHTFPGLAGHCSVFPAPASMPPGRYRMTKSVTYYRRDLSRPESTAQTLSTEFDITP